MLDIIGLTCIDLLCALNLWPCCPRLIKKDEKALDQFLMFGILIEREIRAFGWVAQLVEQGTENPRVRGSIPFPATRIVQARGHLLSGLFSYHETPNISG